MPQAFEAVCLFILMCLKNLSLPAPKARSKGPLTEQCLLLIGKEYFQPVLIQILGLGLNSNPKPNPDREVPPHCHA